MRLLNTFQLKTLLLTTLLALVLFFCAHHLYSHPVSQDIAENLTAGVLVIGITVAFIDKWNAARAHLLYDATEAEAITDIQQTVYLCVATVGGNMQAALKKGTNLDEFEPTPNPVFNGVEDTWYARSRKVIENIDYTRVSERQAKLTLGQMQHAVDETDRTINRYEKALLPASHTALLKLRRKLDVYTSPGLALLRLNIAPSTDITDKKLTAYESGWLKRCLDGLLEVGKMAEALDDVKPRQKKRRF